jgi:hypothetical protein
MKLATFRARCHALCWNPACILVTVTGYGLNLGSVPEYCTTESLQNGQYSPFSDWIPHVDGSTTNSWWLKHAKLQCLVVFKYACRLHTHSWHPILVPNFGELLGQLINVRCHSCSGNCSVGMRSSGCNHKLELLCCGMADSCPWLDFNRSGGVWAQIFLERERESNTHTHTRTHHASNYVTMKYLALHSTCDSSMFMLCFWIAAGNDHFNLLEFGTAVDQCLKLLATTADFGAIGCFSDILQSATPEVIGRSSGAVGRVNLSIRVKSRSLIPWHPVSWD